MAGSERGAASAGTGGLSSFVLKAVAIVGMTANHAGYLFADQLPLWASCVLIGLGGLTFPTMAFLLVEGYRRTSNVKRYAFRLGVFALVSQLPYGLFLADNGNVLFTLLIGLGVLYADEHMRNRGAFWAIAAAGALVSLTCDWGFIGVVVIVLFKKLGAGPCPKGGARTAEAPTSKASPASAATDNAETVSAAVSAAAPDTPLAAAPDASVSSSPVAHGADDAVPALLRTPLGAVAAPVLLVAIADGLPLLGELASSVTGSGDWSLLPFVLYPLVGCPATIPLLYAYRGRRGLPMKWFFYAYYPAHIAVLGVVHLLLFG